MLASLCPRLSHGCQDTRTGRSENNGLLISSFQKEEVAIVGNFCDQWSWLTVSSLVSQVLASLCCQPGWGLGALQLLGLPRLFWGATAFPATSSCGSARGTDCPAAHPLRGAPGGCRACATSCSVLLSPGWLERWDPGRLLLTCPALVHVFPVMLKPPCGCCRQGSAPRAALLPADISVPAVLLYPAQHMPVAACWSCCWFGGR